MGEARREERESGSEARRGEPHGECTVLLLMSIV